uniref:(northern house mosquito) hypothetical protein n=1 Tax=Culex pipiens TaxID=7175 RepID=A0A8D8FRF0_CULPI
MEELGFPLEPKRSSKKHVCRLVNPDSFPSRNFPKTSALKLAERRKKNGPKRAHFSLVNPAPTKTKLQNLLKTIFDQISVKHRPRRLRHQQEHSRSRVVADISFWRRKNEDVLWLRGSSD